MAAKEDELNLRKTELINKLYERLISGAVRNTSKEKK
jgi:hypothetical protein